MNFIPTHAKPLAIVSLDLLRNYNHVSAVPIQFGEEGLQQDGQAPDGYGVVSSPTDVGTRGRVRRVRWLDGNLTLWWPGEL